MKNGSTQLTFGLNGIEGRAGEFATASEILLKVRAPASFKPADVKRTAMTNTRRAISADTALRLARYFNTSGDCWMNLQARYDLQQAEDAFAAVIARQVRPRDAA